MSRARASSPGIRRTFAHCRRAKIGEFCNYESSSPSRKQKRLSDANLSKKTERRGILSAFIWNSHASAKIVDNDHPSL
jgi:hypothetical protein